MHLLDNPIWSALTTTHASLAEGDAVARRYPVGINTLAGMAEDSSDAFESLASVEREKETVALFFEAIPTLPRGWELVRHLDLVQMIYRGEGLALLKDAPKLVALGEAESPEIVELGLLTNPGPIGPRTYEIGDFIGIRGDYGQLIAMAGERLRFPGYSEISGVCTRPSFEGQGLAASLMVRLMKRIRDRGEVPFLHARADNIRAVSLYERLGFALRRHFELMILRRL